MKHCCEPLMAICCLFCIKEIMYWMWILISSGIVTWADILHGWLVNISLFSFFNLLHTHCKENENGIYCTHGTEAVENGKVFTSCAEVLLDGFFLCGRNLFSVFEIKEGGCVSKKCSVITALFGAQWRSLKMHAACKEHSWWSSCDKIEQCDFPH